MPCSYTIDFYSRPGVNLIEIEQLLQSLYVCDKSLCKHRLYKVVKCLAFVGFDEIAVRLIAAPVKAIGIHARKDGSKAFKCIVFCAADGNVFSDAVHSSSYCDKLHFHFHTLF